MSTNLFWEIYKPPHGKSLSVGMKRAIEEEYGREAVLTEIALPFLKGVRAGNPSMDMRDDCDELIHAIVEHGTIRVWVE